ncbi:hypothetical protein ACWF7H_24905 [Peribacillus butanolivorans]
MKKQLENVEVDLCISMSPIYGDDFEWMPLLDPNCKRTIGIAWKKTHYLSQAAIDFLEFTSGFFKHEVSKYFYQ